MQSKQKEYYVEAVNLMKQEKFMDARDLFEILLYKDQKNVDFNLCMGLCQQKLGELIKAEEFYEYSYDKKPKEPKVLIAIFKFYDECMKDPIKAQNYIEQLLVNLKPIDETKYRLYQLKYVKILEKNQEKDKLGQQFEDILNHSDAKNIIDVSAIYIPLKLLLKEIDVSDPKRSPIYKLLSDKLKDKVVPLVSFEALMTTILNTTRKRYHDIEPSLICNGAYFDAIYQLIELFPQSHVILSEVLRYVHCYLEGHIKYPLQLSIQYLVKPIIDDVTEDHRLFTERCKTFITFVKYFASDFLCTYCQELQPQIDSLIQKQQIDIMDDDEVINESQLLRIPIRASQLFKTYQKQKMVDANDLLTTFNNKVREMRSHKLDCSILEEISANLGFEVLIDPNQIIEMKNLLKVRINNKTYSLETYEKYFDYQMKLVKLLRLYDEEIPMRMIFDKILTETPTNLRIAIEKEWLNFSETLDKKNHFLQKLLPYYTSVLEGRPQGLTDKIECTILKRLGTLNMLYHQPNARQCFQRASELNPDDYQPLLGLGMLHYLEHQYGEAIELWQRAFNYCQTDYFLNQIILFGLYKIGLHDRAIEFAQNIYRLPEVQNIFWVNFLLGQHYMSRGQFERAHELLQKAVDLFSFYCDKTYKVYHEKKMEEGSLGIPYFFCQNENYFFCDYPIFSSQFYVDNMKEIFSDTYFVTGKGLKIFQLELKLAELYHDYNHSHHRKKILGHQGSALKSIERAESFLVNLVGTVPQQQIKILDKYLLQKTHNVKSQKLVEILQKFNKISIRSRFISTKKLKLVSLDQVYHVMVLSFESAQLYFFCKQEYYAQERIIQAFLCAVYILEHTNQEITQMINVYIPFLFEMACHFINQTLQHYGYSQALQLSDEYYEIFRLQESANLYSYECYRDFFFLRGTLKKDVESFELSLKYVVLAIQQMGVDISQIDKLVIRDVAAQIQNSQQKKLLLKSHIFCYGLTVLNLKKLSHDEKYTKLLAQIIKFGLSLFPQDDNAQNQKHQPMRHLNSPYYCFYLLLAISSDVLEVKVGSLLQSCKFNPRNQWSLTILGLVAIQQKNDAWAQQLFQKSIESDPSSSVGYLGLALIGLQLFKYNLDLNTNLKELKEYDMFTSNSTFFALIQTQQSIQQKIDSYLKYIQTLENKSFSNLLSLIVRHMLVGTQMQEDEKQNIDYLVFF